MPMEFINQNILLKPLTTTREMSRIFWLINSIGIDQASVPQKTSRIMPTSCKVR